MKSSFVLIALILSIILFSCKTESYVLNGSKFYTNKADKKYQIDSFKVVKVIDNRKTKDSVIGIADEDNNKLTIDRPLVDYLKLGFNTLICKDSNQTNFIPVTITVDEFFSNRFATFWKPAVNHKFTYLFEYPFGSEIKKLSITDSLLFFDDPSVTQQIGLINKGIRESERLFIEKLKYDKFIDSINKYSSEPKTNQNKIDSINLVRPRIFENKIGILTNYYLGQKTQFGYLYSFQIMSQRLGGRVGTAFGFSFQYNQIKTEYKIRSIFGFNTQYTIRYNLIQRINGLFLGGGLFLILGMENASHSDYKFVGGIRIEESLGIYLTNNFTLSAGLYQIGLIGSELLPTEIGLVFSLSFTFDIL